MIKELARGLLTFLARTFVVVVCFASGLAVAFGLRVFDLDPNPQSVSLLDIEFPIDDARLPDETLLFSPFRQSITAVSDVDPNVEALIEFSDQSRYMGFANGVGRIDLLVKGTKGGSNFIQPCTGILISSHYVLTAHHCLLDWRATEISEAGAAPPLATILDARFVTGLYGDQDDSYGKAISLNVTPVDFGGSQKQELDFAVFLIPDNQLEKLPSDSWSPVELDSTAPLAAQDLFVIHYPLGGVGQLTRRACRVRDIREGAFITHTCGTLPGTSGAPIFNERTGKVIALHVAGDRSFAPANSTDKNSIGIAIPISEISAVSDIVRQQINDGTFERSSNVASETKSVDSRIGCERGADVEKNPFETGSNAEIRKPPPPEMRPIDPCDVPDPAYDTALSALTSFDELVEVIGPDAQEVEDGEYMETVVIFSNTSNRKDELCTGVLLSPKLVVTAAHCTERDKPFAVVGSTVGFGTSGNNLIAQTTVRDVRAARLNKSFSNGRYAVTLPETGAATLPQSDLALLLLKDPAPQNIPTASLANVSDISSAELGLGRVVGFGRANNREGGIKNRVDVALVNWNCTGSIRQPTKGLIERSDWYGCKRGNELVAGAVNEAEQLSGLNITYSDNDTCEGDSGGPFFVAPNGQGRIPKSHLKYMEGVDDSAPEYYLAAVTARAVNSDYVKSGASRCGNGGLYSLLTGRNLEWMEAWANAWGQKLTVRSDI